MQVSTYSKYDTPSLSLEARSTGAMQLHGEWEHVWGFLLKRSSWITVEVTLQCVQGRLFLRDIRGHPARMIPHTGVRIKHGLVVRDAFIM